MLDPRVRNQPVAAHTGCPKCEAFNYLNADSCWRCLVPFKEGELRGRWENEHARGPVA